MYLVHILNRCRRGLHSHGGLGFACPCSLNVGLTESHCGRCQGACGSCHSVLCISGLYLCLPLGHGCRGRLFSRLDRPVTPKVAAMMARMATATAMPAHVRIRRLCCRSRFSSVPGLPARRQEVPLVRLQLGLVRLRPALRLRQRLAAQQQPVRAASAPPTAPPAAARCSGAPRTRRRCPARTGAISRSCASSNQVAPRRCSDRTRWASTNRLMAALSAQRPLGCARDPSAPGPRIPRLGDELAVGPLADRPLAHAGLASPTAATVSA